MSIAEPVYRLLFSPYGRISQVPLDVVRQALIQVFLRWGKPGAMRVDNGLPLGSPDRLAPPVLALWLISMDIDMIWNKPGCPQQNGRVEKMQDTTARWAEVTQARDGLHLQRDLDAALVLQRERYKVTRLRSQSRLAAYPQLETSRRAYSEGDFNAGRVYTFLSGKLYTRKVSESGQIVHFGEVHSVGRLYKQQWVQLRLLADGTRWEVLADYNVVKRLPANTLTIECLQTLTVFQRTNTKLDDVSQA